MVSFDIAFDEADAGLGHYFLHSKLDLVSFIQKECGLHSINEIPSKLCNEAYIQLRISQVNSNNFLFVAYSHGGDDSLTANGTFYIKRDVNSILFCNSLFYSMSCLTGKVLGSDLVSKGCHAFIGFKDEAEALLGSYLPLSIECDNYGIKSFIKGASIKDAFNSMKDYFTDKSDWLEQKGEPLLAAFLVSNRDALWFEGNPHLTFNDFNT